MEKQNILKADYLDIVFDNRNKKYGGYELRRNYSKRAKRAMVSVLLGVSVICAAPVIASNLTGKPPVISKSFDPEKTIEIDNIRLQPKTEPEPAPTPSKSPDKAPAPTAPTVINTPPIIKPTNEVTREALPVDSMEGKIAGTRNSAGQPGGTAADQGQETGTGGIAGQGNGYSEPPAPFADIMPEFDGDLYAYMSKHVHYPQTAAAQGDEGRSVIEFVVNENGNLSDVKLAKSAGSSILDAEAIRVVSSMPKWKPGKTKGKNVKVYFKIPITFVMD